uniref:Uncharacterized protein n=2 Tax=Trichogramma kaykai TaxID=54128 RepID=A0ABD2WUJ8_9HYME
MDGIESDGEIGSDATDVDQDWLKIIGDDPSSEKGQKMEIREDILKIWKFFCREGMSIEKEQALIQKYSILPELAPPELNPQLESALKNSAKKRDMCMLAIQKIASQGSVMSKIYNQKEEGLDLEEVLAPLKDTGDLFTLIINKQSKNRSCPARQLECQVG